VGLPLQLDKFSAALRELLHRFVEYDFFSGTRFDVPNEMTRLIDHICVIWDIAVPHSDFFKILYH